MNVAFMVLVVVVVFLLSYVFCYGLLLKFVVELEFSFVGGGIVVPDAFAMVPLKDRRA